MKKKYGLFFKRGDAMVQRRPEWREKWNSIKGKQNLTFLELNEAIQTMSDGTFAPGPFPRTLSLLVSQERLNEVKRGAIKDVCFRASKFWKKKLAGVKYDCVKLYTPANDSLLVKYSGVIKRRLDNSAFGRDILVYAVHVGGERYDREM